MVPVDREEYQRWLGQAEHTLASARRDLSASDFDWACFKAQQAAEYVLKALLRALGNAAVGHSLVKLAETLQAQAGVAIPEPLWQAARTLDRHYIPPRYPDAYPSGMPYEFYDAPTAGAAIDAAQRMLEFVRERAQALGVEPGEPPKEDERTEEEG